MDKDIRTAIHALLFFSIISVLLLLLPLSSFVNVIRVVMGYTFFPFMRNGHHFVHYVSNLPEAVSLLPTLYDETQRLTTELDKRIIDMAQYKSVLKENERLTALVNRLPNKTFFGVWGSVINYDISDRYSMIVVNRGTQDDVEAGNPVLSIANGETVLVGRVVEVSRNTCFVLFITDISSSVTAVMEGSSTGLLLQGGGGPVLSLSYIPGTSEILPGKKVYVSPNSAVFPPDILIGEVTEVLPDSLFVNYKTALVAPAIDVQGVSEVFLVTSFKREGNT